MAKGLTLEEVIVFYDRGVTTLVSQVKKTERNRVSQYSDRLTLARVRA